MAITSMLGFRGTRPGLTDLSAATKALRQAIGARGKKWKRVASQFAFVGAGNEFAVGVVLREAPQTYDVPSYGFFDSPLSRFHPVVSTQPTSQSVDDHAQASDGLAPALMAITEALGSLGLTLEGSHGTGEERLILISADGARGALIFGGPSTSDTSAPLESWSFDPSDREGEVTRIAGFRLAAIDRERPIVALPKVTPREWLDQLDEQRRALASVGITAPMLLLMALDHAQPSGDGAPLRGR